MLYLLYGTKLFNIKNTPKNYPRKNHQDRDPGVSANCPFCPTVIWLENGDVIQYYPKEAQGDKG